MEAMAEEDSDEGFEYTADPGISPILRQASHITNSPTD